MEAKNKEKLWGGRRIGAGRPKLTPSRLFTLRLPSDLAKVVEAHDNKNEFIKGCILQSMRHEEECIMGISCWGEIYPATMESDLTIPFFDIGIVAGFPIPLDNDERAQDINLLRMLCPNPESCYLIRVKGDSMIDAGINSGDIVIVDKSNRCPNESEVAVCEFNGEYTLKHFVKNEGCGWLVPANPNFPKIKITPNDTFSIWGTVTYIIHKPKA